MFTLPGMAGQSRACAIWEFAKMILTQALMAPRQNLNLITLVAIHARPRVVKTSSFGSPAVRGLKRNNGSIFVTLMFNTSYPLTFIGRGLGSKD